MVWELAREVGKGSGIFGDFEVHGVQIESGDGMKAWRIDMWRSGRNPVEHYFVRGTQVWRASRVLTTDPDYPMAWQKEESVAQVEISRQQVIFDAIAKWESESAPAANSGSASAEPAR